MAPKRARKRLKGDNASVEKENVPVAKPSRRGKKDSICSGSMICFTTLPYDVLLEVFRHLLPLDLLHLCSVTPCFRDILHNKYATRTWRSARANALDMPAPSPGLSEMQWAHLAFVKICNFCWTKKVVMPDFRLRTRICAACSELHLIGKDDMKESISSDERVMIDLKFFLVPTHTTTYRRDKILDVYALTTEYEDVEGSMLGILTNKERLVEYAEDRLLEAQAIVNNGRKAHNWLDRWNKRRSDEIATQKNMRKQAIYDKLCSLGYKTDMDAMKMLGISDSFTEHPMVNQTRPLSERIWDHITADMIKFAEDVRSKRLDHEKLVLVNSRKPLVVDLLRAFKKGLPPAEFYPSLPDLYEWPPLKAILSQPADQEVTCDSFVPVFEHLSAFFVSCHQQAFGTLVKLVDPDINKLSIIEAKLMMRRVSSVIFCSYCGNFPYAPPSARRPYYYAKVIPIFGEEAFSHICARKARNYACWISGTARDQTLRLANDNWNERIKWRSDWFKREDRLCEIVKWVVGLVGKDGNALVEDMDRSSNVFECKSQHCVDDGDDERQLYGWRTMIQHIFEVHLFEDLAEYRSDVIVRKYVSSEDLPDGWELAKIIEKEASFECFACRDLPEEKLDGRTKNLVIEHIKEAHGEEHPQDGKDFALLVGSSSSALPTRMVVHLRKKRAP